MLNICDNSSIITSSNLSSIQNIILTSGNMTINKKIGGSSVYSLLNIRKINFTSVLTEINTPQLDSKVILYPSIVQEVLNIELMNNIITPLHLNIYSVEGKLVLKEIIKNSKNTISVSTLPKGIYICKYNELSTYNKFIKQ